MTTDLFGYDTPPTDDDARASVDLVLRRAKARLKTQIDSQQDFGLWSEDEKLIWNLAIALASATEDEDEPPRLRGTVIYPEQFR